MVYNAAVTSRQQAALRASASDMRHLLCYFCGDILKSREEYNLHRLNHEIEDIATQVAQHEFKRTRDERPLYESDEDETTEDIYAERKQPQTAISQTHIGTKTQNASTTASNRPILTPKYAIGGGQGKIDNRRRNRQLPPPPPLHIPTYPPAHLHAPPSTLSSSDVSTSNYFPSPASDILTPISSASSVRPRRLLTPRTSGLSTPSFLVPPESISLSLDVPLPPTQPASIADTIEAVAMGIAGQTPFDSSSSSSTPIFTISSNSNSNVANMRKVPMQRKVLPQSEVEKYDEKKVNTEQSEKMKSSLQKDAEYVKKVIDQVALEKEREDEQLQLQGKSGKTASKRKRDSKSSSQQPEEVPVVKKIKEKSSTPPPDEGGDKRSNSQQLPNRRTTACHFCEFVAETSLLAARHVVSSHGSRISSCAVRLYHGNRQLSKNTLRAGDECPSPNCHLRFENPTKYYMHVVEDHILDIVNGYKTAFEHFDNYECELIFRKDEQDTENYTTVLSGEL